MRSDGESTRRASSASVFSARNGWVASTRDSGDIYISIDDCFGFSPRIPPVRSRRDPAVDPFRRFFSTLPGDVISLENSKYRLQLRFGRIRSRITGSLSSRNVGYRDTASLNPNAMKIDPAPRSNHMAVVGRRRSCVLMAPAK